MTQYPTPNAQRPSADRRWILLVTLFTMLLTLLPYLIGWLDAQERPFMWLGYNLDDSCVYLSWMRQAADGSLRALNLFTTDTQKGMLLNPFFLVLGWFARITHLPLLAVYHLARLACGAGLLLIVWKFIKITLAAPFARRLALLCVCFASGLGWLPLPWASFPTAPTCPAGPIDLWQPEAITFLSLLLSPLFCFSLALQIGALLLLFKGEQTGQMRYAIGAGICGFILGLTHTYDVLSVGAVWMVYLCILTLRGFHHTIRAWFQAVVAGICTAPAVAYIYYELQTEAIFLKRANVVTASALPLWIVLGYGSTLALAIYYLIQAAQTNKNREPKTVSETAADTSTSDTNVRQLTDQEGNQATMPFVNTAALHLLVVWIAINILVSYLPVSKFPFQRKMLQGAHFPIAILAGCGLAFLLTNPVLRSKFRNRNLAAALILLVLALTNVRFIVRELSNYSDNRVQSGQRAYLNPGELEALHWIETHTPAGTAIQPLPWVILTNDHKLALADMTLACFVPGLIHRNVYCGHWGETPDYGDKLHKLINFTKPNLPDQSRMEMLIEMRVQYLLFSQKHYQPNPDLPFYPLLSEPVSVPPYLELVYSNADADVYKVNLTTITSKTP